jgi:hypothetical protein
MPTGGYSESRISKNLRMREAFDAKCGAPADYLFETLACAGLSRGEARALLKQERGQNEHQHHGTRNHRNYKDFNP